jgi:hypothetical protein
MDKARTLFFVCAGLLGLSLLLPRPAAADWPTDLVNVPLCTAVDQQFSPAIVSDGAGGAIVIWQDYRSGGYPYSPNIYAQRITAEGAVSWTADGVAICTDTHGQYEYAIASDGAGGAIVTWTDYRNAHTNIYAQRISAAGMVQWPADGVAICTAGDGQSAPAIVSDGAGGAIIAWMDQRVGGWGTINIYAQRISAAGAVQWLVDGVPLCTADGNQEVPRIVSDGVGGAIVTWQDFRNSTDYDIYAQRVSADGTVLWAASDGVALCVTPNQQKYPKIVADGASGAIVSWMDLRSGATWDIYAQRVLAGGAVLWTAEGVALSTATGNQMFPTITTDGAGGAIVTWNDYRGSDDDIYSQRISDVGAALWMADGVPLCTAAGRQIEPITVSDGAGGAIVTWYDQRNGDTNNDIYGQRISAGGSIPWPADGVAISTASSHQDLPAIVADGAGGAIVAWEDRRSGGYDIYAQRVWTDGSTPVLLSLVSADVTADGVKLAWFAGENASAVATVYRSPAGGEWTRIGEITADGTGYLRYTDPIDAMAARVGYRLGIVEAGIEGLYGEMWLDLPAGNVPLAFALDPVRPNPSRGGALTVRFSVPSASPARLELLDVAGRRIASHEVGIGQHTLDLGQGQRLAPGLYLVRLTHGTNTRTTRVAVLQ